MFTSIKFKIKDGYKLELQTPEIIKFFGSTKKNNRKNKIQRKCPSVEVVEVLLVQYDVVDN